MGRFLWARLGDGELLLLTFYWPGLSHRATRPAWEAGTCAPAQCLGGRGDGFHDLAGNLCHTAPPKSGFSSPGRKKE